MIPLSLIDPTRPLVYWRAKDQQCNGRCTSHAVEHGRVVCRMDQGIPLAPHVMAPKAVTV